MKPRDFKEVPPEITGKKIQTPRELLRGRDGQSFPFLATRLKRGFHLLGRRSPNLGSNLGGLERGSAHRSELFL
jgi:hypothetical protein